MPEVSLLVALGIGAASLAVGALVAGLICLVCPRRGGGLWVKLALCALVSVLLPNAVYLLLFYKHPQFRQSVQFAEQITKGKLPLSRWLFPAKK